MNDFSITLDYKEYKVRSTQSNAEACSWDITVSHGEVKTNIRIPIEKKVTRAKVILFIDASNTNNIIILFIL